LPPLTISSAISIYFSIYYSSQVESRDNLIADLSQGIAAEKALQVNYCWLRVAADSHRYALHNNSEQEWKWKWEGGSSNNRLHMLNSEEKRREEKKSQ
jgi:hypothetical protein